MGRFKEMYADIIEDDCYGEYDLDFKTKEEREEESKPLMPWHYFDLMHQKDGNL